MKKMTRVFEGKRYDFMGAHKTKESAKTHKKTLKEKGYLVRVVKGKKGHGVYCRKK